MNFPARPSLPVSVCRPRLPHLSRLPGLVLAAMACAASLGLTLAAHGQDLGGTESGSGVQPVLNSGIDAELFYQLLVGEMQVRSGEPGAGYSLLLDAARKNGQPELYRRAIEIALMARSADAALAATRTWSTADPSQIEPQRYELQMLLALDRTSEIGPALGALVRLTPATLRNELIAALPSLLSRASDKTALLVAASPVLENATRDPATAAAAWVSLGRLRLAAGQPEQALEAAQRALHAEPQRSPAALLALALAEQGLAGAEALVTRQLAAPGDPGQAGLRLEYARLLLDQRRYTDAEEQLRLLMQQAPELAEAWLLQGVLQLQLAQPAAARTALTRYLELSSANAAAQVRGRNQAYLLLAQAAERLKQFREAEDWLGRVVDGDPALLQMRRASLLARQGRLAEARKLLREPMAETAPEWRRQALAEAQLLRDLGQHREALKVYREASERFPEDSDLAYEWAMAAEKAGQPREMERLLRALIARQPDHAHGLNALGYHLADRNERLPEARELIRRALELAPSDPFILDSMGWVEYRLGQFPEARRLLQQAWTRRPDPEIAAHLGEVLWVSGEREAALQVWRQGLRLGADNQTLIDTLGRLKVKP